MFIHRIAVNWLPNALAALTFGTPLTALAQEAHLARVAVVAELPSAPMPMLTAYQQSTPALPSPQVPAPAQESPASPPLTELQRQKAEEQLRKEEKQRIAGVMPNFNTVYGQEAPPLTAGEKYRLALRSSIDPFTFAAAGLLALIGQAEDSHEGYHQGLEGYGKRLGANYADSFSGTFFGNAFFPALLHEDPRYFRMGEGIRPKRRILYALSTTIRTRTDSGRRTWNYANVLGNIAAGGLSNLYYPSEDRGVALIFESAATVTAEGAIGALGIEFYPDIARKLFHHKQRPGTSATSPQTNPQTPMNPAPPHP